MLETNEAAFTILTADDNPAVLSLIMEVLGTRSYRVLSARDGEAALRIAATERPDLVLLDVHMPRIDGYGVCAAMKRDPKLTDIPVIILSGMDEVFNKVHAFESGAVDYIVKPFHAKELLARVTTHLELGRSRARIVQYAQQLEAALEGLHEAEKRARMAEKQTALARLSSGLAHELNNPVNYIMAGAEALSMSFQELLSALEAPLAAGTARPIDRISPETLAEIPKLIDGIKLGATRTTRIVKGLEAYTQHEPEERTEAELVPLVENALALALERNPGRLKIQREFASAPRLSCYPRKLTELLFNLIDNAVVAALESAEATVTLGISPFEAEGRSFAAVIVADSGAGISKEDQERIFDPFFTTKEIGKGAGLGLSVALGLATEHGGSLELLETGPGKTVFRLSLPL